MQWKQRRLILRRAIVTLMISGVYFLSLVLLILTRSDQALRKLRITSALFVCCRGRKQSVEILFLKWSRQGHLPELSARQSQTIYFLLPIEYRFFSSPVHFADAPSGKCIILMSKSFQHDDLLMLWWKSISLQTGTDTLVQLCSDLYYFSCSRKFIFFRAAMDMFVVFFNCFTQAAPICSGPRKNFRTAFGSWLMLFMYLLCVFRASWKVPANQYLIKN